MLLLNPQVVFQVNRLARGSESQLLTDCEEGAQGWLLKPLQQICFCCLILPISLQLWIDKQLTYVLDVQ